MKVWNNTSLRLIVIAILMSLCLQQRCAHADEGNCYGNHDNSKRSTPSTIDPSKSTISGSGISKSIVISETNSINVIAKDSSGNNLGVGGDNIYILISNQCTRGINMYCDPISGATSVLSSQIIAKMTDNGDGSYSYSYSIGKLGNITVSIILMTHIDVIGTYFNTTNLSGPIYTTNSSSNIYHYWGTGPITDKSDYVSATFSGKLVPFTSETYTISIEYDDGASLFIDGNILVSFFTSATSSIKTVNINFEAFTIHNILIEWHDNTLSATCALTWSSPSISNETIPASNFGTSSDVASSPYQVQVSCPVGYTSSGVNLLPCVVLCGDGLRYENEACDDGNINNEDGCRSDCMQIDLGWICVVNNITRIDACSKCDVGYESNSNKDKCVAAPLSNKTKTYIVTIACLILIGSVFNLINQSNSQSIFCMVNQIQLILLIPMLRSYIPFDLLQLQ